MELNDHVAKLAAHESLFDQEMMAGMLQLLIDTSRKYDNYNDLANALMEIVDMRNEPEVDPAVFDEALKPLLAHIFKECPDVCPVFQSLFKAEYPEFAPMFSVVTSPHTPANPSPPAVDDCGGRHFPHKGEL